MLQGNRAARYSSLAVFGFLFIHLLCTPWMRAAYLAPIMGFFFTLIVVGLWKLEMVRWRDWNVGRAISIALTIGIIVLGLCWAISYVDLLKQVPFSQRRAALVADLKRQPGPKWLVFVHYSPNHPIYLEAVFNDADIDGSDVVFAREMDESQNRALMAYFSSRRAVLLDADDFRISPMPPR